MKYAWLIHLAALRDARISYYYEKWGTENLAKEVERNDKIITLFAPFWCFEDAQKLWLDKIFELVSEGDYE